MSERGAPPDHGPEGEWPSISLARSLLRLALRIGLILLVVVAVHLLIGWSLAALERLPGETMWLARLGVIGLVLVAYALIIATPFVPGLEIGIGILMLQGPPAAPLVWLSTVAGLYLAYLVGHLMPARVLQDILIDLRLHRASAALARIDQTPPQRRLALLRQRLPRWLAALVTRRRYITLAILFNLPGNAVLGGGGGLSLISGMSGLFEPRATLLTMFLATLPIPLLVMIAGQQGLKLLPGWP